MFYRDQKIHKNLIYLYKLKMDDRWFVATENTVDPIFRTMAHAITARITSDYQLLSKTVQFHQEFTLVSFPVNVNSREELFLQKQ